MSDWKDELRLLGELRDDAILTQEEFQTEKGLLLEKARQTYQQQAPVSSDASRLPDYSKPPPSEVDPTTVRIESREPSCEVCGSQPAAQIVLRQLTGLVVVMSSMQYNPVLCAPCGEIASRESQRQTLAKGWWSVGSAVLNPIVLAANSRNRRKHRNNLRD
jgi:hypothetical protein